jgi:hypothetical protein
MKYWVLCGLAAGVLVSGQQIPDTFSGAPRIVVVGDVHGDFGQFTGVLQGAGLLDKKNKWIGGKTHLVQLGDVPDRGPATRKIMDLLMDLEKQARKAGGAVHALIGNHEAMNIQGDLRYTIPEEFASFKTGQSEEIRQQFWEQISGEMKKAGKDPTDAVKKEWLEEHPAGWFEHRYEFGPKGKYYKWISGHNALVKVNDTLFLHGGVSPKYVEIAMAVLNDTIRKGLPAPDTPEGAVVVDSDGPLWYRGLAHAPELELTPHVDNVLAKFGVKRVVIGHTPTAGAIIPRFGGKVLMADVGLSAAYGSRMACVVIEGETVYALHRGKRLELPKDGGPDLARYLKEAAALDPQPSPLAPVIERVEAALVGR